MLLPKPFRLSIVAFILILGTACSKVPKQANYIPKDAVVVGSLNMKNMSQKLIWGALTGSELFDELQKNVKNEESKKAMKDVSNIGLDQLSTVYFYATGNFKNDATACVIIGMKEQGRFEKFIQTNYPQASITKKDKYSYAVIENNMHLAWNKEVAMVFPNANLATQSEGLEADVTLDQKNALSVIEQVFNLSKDQSLASNKHFGELQSDDHDISFWLNYESMYQQNPEINEGAAKAFMKPEFFKDAAMAAGFDFEKGSIDAVADYYISSELSPIFSKYMKNCDAADMIKKLPSGNVAFLMSYHFQAEMIKELLAKFKLDGLADIGLMAAGLSMNSLTQAFNGDMLMAITDLQKGDSLMQTGTPKMEFFMAMTQNDQSSMDQLLGTAVKKGLFVKSGSDFKLAMGSSDFTVMNDKKYLAMSTKGAYAKSFLDGNNSNKVDVPAAILKNFDNNPYAFYVDMKKVMQVLPIETTDPDEKALIEEGMNMLSYAEMHGGQMKKGASHSEGTLEFVNQNENAFLQILQFAIKAKKLKDKKDAERPQEAEVMADTVSVVN
ncbi:MAG: DUF4836 family protein [Chitinophagaceae bacterium]|nr:DUF4836 family protein [Chitinophagaceae bacterium]